MASSETTTDHDTIREWIEARDGTPTIVGDTADDEGEGILRVDFQERDEALEEVSWDKFFEIFEDRKLAFLYQDETADGEESRFCKFVNR